jgi:hypothetical protein
VLWMHLLARHSTEGWGLSTSQIRGLAGVWLCRLFALCSFAHYQCTRKPCSHHLHACAGMREGVM